MPDATIHAVGKILENLNPVLYRVELPNGKLILARMSFVSSRSDWLVFKTHSHAIPRIRALSKS